MSLAAKVAVFACYGLFVAGALTVFAADVYYKNARNAFGTGDYIGAYKNANKAAALNPNEPRYFRENAKDELVVSPELAPQSLEKAYELNPNNLLTLRDVIPLYFLLTRENSPKLPVSILQTAIQRAKAFAPNDAGVMVLAAKYEKKAGLTEDFEKTVDVIRRLRPDLLDWHETLK
ncbi:MAG: hypothetical protein UX44_C0004G0015 [candidate division WWE3 bacterium GW2011_GWA1_46_21]|uniref:Uncharacterized protein n=2 Tax=Katanobacteria TaxID=422282 RepID=A0A0G1PFZ4_UNCKA|nr:MAG: hypothetical protein UX44_C0004G0015 [candidate division WWE3 bacterium GW2011_GWA1_46_21]KKU57676.1 MAG: hypothetical protein UX79_C0006G0012 [candidate division WWE3 bacterium GW2011_GWB1_47_11]